jgi:hypothetical protein
MRPLPPRRHALISLAILVGAVVAATVVAELAGAANLGTALAFGQMAFALALVFVLIRR